MSNLIKHFFTKPRNEFLLVISFCYYSINFRLTFPAINESYIKIDDISNPISTSSYLKKCFNFPETTFLGVKINFILCEVFQQQIPISLKWWASFTIFVHRQSIIKYHQFSINKQILTSMDIFLLSKNCTSFQLFEILIFIDINFF